MNVVLSFMSVLVLVTVCVLVYLSLETTLTPFRTKKRIREFRFSDWLRLVPMVLLLSIITSLWVVIEDRSTEAYALLVVAVSGWVGVVLVIVYYTRLPHIMDLTWGMAAPRYFGTYREITSRHSSFAGFFTADGTFVPETLVPSAVVISTSVFTTDAWPSQVMQAYRSYLALTGHKPAGAETVGATVNGPMTKVQWFTSLEEGPTCLHVLVSSRQEGDWYQYLLTSAEVMG